MRCNLISNNIFFFGKSGIQSKIANISFFPRVHIILSIPQSKYVEKQHKLTRKNYIRKHSHKFPPLPLQTEKWRNHKISLSEAGAIRIMKRRRGDGRGIA